MGYVFAACANLGVGGSTESWKTVFGKYLLASLYRIFANILFSTYQYWVPLRTDDLQARMLSMISITDADCKLNSGSQLACPSV
jgi:hypothetical protein